MRGHIPEQLRQAPFTVAQARAAGVTDRQLQSSRFRRVLHQVYVLADTTDTVEMRARAVKLVLPSDAVVADATAAWLHGADVLDTSTAGLVRVLVQRGDQMRRAGIRALSALLEPDDVTEVVGVPVTTPVRTAFDLARRRDVIEAVVGVDAMLNRGGCELNELTAYVAEHRGWRGVRYADEALRHAEPLSESPMESRQRMRLVLAGLPRPVAQVPVADGHGVVFARIDNGYPDWRVGVDYDGGVHATRWVYDLERQERVRDTGWWHRRYTAIHIQSGWPQMVRQVGAALVAAGWSPGRTTADHAEINARRLAER